MSFSSKDTYLNLFSPLENDRWTPPTVGTASTAGQEETLPVISFSSLCPSVLCISAYFYLLLMLPPDFLTFPSSFLITTLESWAFPSAAAHWILYLPRHPDNALQLPKGWQELQNAVIKHFNRQVTPPSFEFLLNSTRCGKSPFVTENVRMINSTSSFPVFQLLLPFHTTDNRWCQQHKNQLASSKLPQVFDNKLHPTSNWHVNKLNNKTQIIPTPFHLDLAKLWGPAQTANTSCNHTNAWII